MVLHNTFLHPGGTMAHKSLSQVSFSDLMLNLKKGLNESLDKVNNLVDWQPIEKILGGIYNSVRGPKSYPPLTLFKALLIQTWYDLSDYQLEEAMDDRLSFRRFVGLASSDSVPDHSTFSLFRTQLRERKLIEDVLNEVNRQLETHGQIIRKGTIVDATLVEASVKKPDQKDNGQAGKSNVDPDAEWVCRGSKRYFGYKAHMSVDSTKGFILKAKLTTAKDFEGHVLEEILPAKQEWIFADKAYESKNNEAMLMKKGLKNGIMRKAARYIKLESMHRLRNRLISKTRQRIERTFGTLKRWYGYTKVRYIGLSRNTLQMFLLCISFNLKKWMKAC